MSGLNAPWFLQNFVDPANGKPLAGGKLYFFVAGSTTLPKNVYTDFALLMPWTQPLILDGGGYAPEYFMEPGLYKVVVTRAGGNPNSPVYTRDNVAGAGAGAGGSGIDSYMVKTIAGDTVPAFLADKFVSSFGINWTSVLVNGSWKLRLNIAAGAIPGMYTVKTEAGDSEPGYLLDKLIESGSVKIQKTGEQLSFYVDEAFLNAWATVKGFAPAPTTPESRVWFAGPSGGLSSSSDLTWDGNFLNARNVNTRSAIVENADVPGRSVTVTPNGVDGIGDGGATLAKLDLDSGCTVKNAAGTAAVSGDKLTKTSMAAGRVQFSAQRTGDAQPYIYDDNKLLYDGSKLTAPGLKLSGAGAGVVVSDADGNFSVDPGGKTLVNASDEVPGYLETKIVAGTGIRISQTTDAENGTVMHISAVTGTGDYFQAQRPKSSPYSFSSLSSIFSFLNLPLVAGTYVVSLTICAEINLSSGSTSMMCSAEDGLSVLTTDGYTGYSDFATGTGTKRMIAISAKRKIRLLEDGTIYGNVFVDTTATYSGGVAWGSLVAERLST